ncbi:hypothetical protein D3C80_1817380 [compost metagenome]
MKMGVAPAHHRLNNLVQLAQGDALGHGDPAPDGGFYPRQFDVQLQETVVGRLGQTGDVGHGSSGLMF